MASNFLSYGAFKDFFKTRFFFVDIEDLPPTVQEKLFDEVLDRDVQKGKHETNEYNLIFSDFNKCFALLCKLWSSLVYSHHILFLL